MAVKVPTDALIGIKAVRDSGLTNMLDVNRVVELCAEWGYGKSAQWIRDHRADYARLLFEGPESSE